MQYYNADILLFLQDLVDNNKNKLKVFYP
jgi:hypothetical protein